MTEWAGFLIWSADQEVLVGGSDQVRAYVNRQKVEDRKSHFSICDRNGWKFEVVNGIAFVDLGGGLAAAVAPCWDDGSECDTLARGKQDDRKVA